jgi:serine protease Do
MKNISMQMKYFLIGALAVLIGVLAYGNSGKLDLGKINGDQTKKDESPIVGVSPYESKNGYEQAIITAVESASPAIVSITVSKNVPVIENCQVNPFGNIPPEFQEFFGGLQFTQPCEKGTRMQDIGGGSGFIVSSDGMIVTNKHVVADKEASYTVFTNDGKKYKAKVLARDPMQDVAIVKIEATGLPVVKLGDSDGIRLGQAAVAIGNALGEYRNTVSVGIISGLARTVTASSQGGSDSETLEGVIQTDAAINPGNSGGPLINLKGEVIGINTAVVSGANNIGFSIPINNVKRDISSVKKSGKITSPFLGVRYIMLNEDVAKKEELSVSEGALVRGSEDGPAVTKNSPADKAGILAEDIITEVGGVKVNKEHSLVSLIQRYNVGDTLALRVLRGEESLLIKVTLEERK